MSKTNITECGLKEIEKEIGRLIDAVVAMDVSIAIVKQMLAVRDDMINTIAAARSDSVLAALPNLLLASPAMSAKQLAKSHDVSFPAVKNAPDRMETLGYELGGGPPVEGAVLNPCRTCDRTESSCSERA